MSIELRPYRIIFSYFIIWGTTPFHSKGKEIGLNFSSKSALFVWVNEFINMVNWYTLNGELFHKGEVFKFW